MNSNLAPDDVSQTFLFLGNLPGSEDDDTEVASDFFPDGKRYSFSHFCTKQDIKMVEVLIQGFFASPMTNEIVEHIHMNCMELSSKDYSTRTNIKFCRVCYWKCRNIFPRLY